MAELEHDSLSLSLPAPFELCPTCKISLSVEIVVDDLAVFGCSGCQEVWKRELYGVIRQTDGRTHLYVADPGLWDRGLKLHIGYFSLPGHETQRWEIEDSNYTLATFHPLHGAQ